ncbi:MAG: DUF7144 family membrane protein [Ktedonobacteraceae bacterium]
MEITRTHSRPTGISIIAVLLFVAAALDIVYGILAMIKVPVFVTSTGAAVVVQVSPWGFLLWGLLGFLVGYGLWTLKGWAFWTVAILEIASLIFGFVLLFSAFNIWAVLLSMVFPAVILIYLFVDSHVREAFNIG